MASNVFTIEDGVFGLTLTDPGDDIGDVTIADFGDFTCQVTSGALEATPNTTTAETPATWCQPASSEVVPGVTSYQLTMTMLQDPHIINGISRFLFQHDTESGWWYMGFDAENPPRAFGQCRMVAGTIGGAARESLTFDVVLPVRGKPQVEFGDATSSIVVGGKSILSPGMVVASDPDVSGAVGDTAKLAAVTANYLASPATAWTTGQEATVAGFDVHWTSTVWAAGPAT